MGNKHPEVSLCAHIAQKQLRHSFCATAQINVSAQPTSLSETQHEC